MDIKSFKFKSQHNEDGLLQWIFGIITPENKVCVEFGAWDGVYLSNTYNLIANHEWSGILIEGDKKKARELEVNYPVKERIKAIYARVGWTEKNSLDKILGTCSIPQNFDLLSVDIDNNDYHVWKALTQFKPKVVVIEINTSIPNDIDFFQEANPRVNHGTSLRAMVRLGNEKGYELVAVTPTNALFVDVQYFPLFNLQDNSIDTLHPQEPFPRVYQLFDGTIVLTDNYRLRWKDVNVGKYDLQKIPHFMRNPKANIFTRIFRKLFKKLLYRLLVNQTETI